MSMEPMTCPWPNLESRWDEAGEEKLVELDRCGAQLFLVYDIVRDLYVGESLEDYADDVTSATKADTWEVRCENGHRVLASPDPDNYIPFDPTYLLTL